MNLIVLILTLLPCILYAQHINPFEKTFNVLHKEPPPPQTKLRSVVITEWIEQKVNNFDCSETKTWRMRYMANEDFFKPGGPIFIFVGGEWAISEGYIKGGLMVDMAIEMGGYLFYTEHRYYGESYPTKDLSADNLKYLSVDQALADLAYFIKQMKATNPELKNSKVFLVGGSYSASMVTWFSRVYPNLVDGTWASSAPLLAKVDFTEYKEVVTQSIKLVGGDKCYNRIENAIKQLEKMLDNNKIQQLQEALKLCESFDIKNSFDVWSLFSSISDLFAGLVQGHSKGSIEGACELIMSSDDDISGVTAYIKRALGESTCYDFTYKSFVESMSDTKLSGIMRQWYYQTCSEFGWYQTSGSENQIFGRNFPVDLYVELCHDVYAQKFNNVSIHENIIRTNKLYGGMNPEAKNVYISHGHLDPWRAMGIQSNTEQSAVIPLYAHCKDFGSITDDDTAEMKASKLKVLELARKWLGFKKE